MHDVSRPSPSSHSGASSDPEPPGLPVFTLRLGSVAGGRPPAQDVADLLVAAVPSFSLTPCEGFFQGRPDPGWAVTLAVPDPAVVAGLAEILRHHFAQEGVGVEAYGRYLRCHAGCGAAALLAEIQGLAHGLLPAYFLTRFSVPALPPQWPGRFAILTAWATTGEHWPDERNRAADESLRQELVQRGLPHHRIVGASPDGQHAEPGWIVETELQEAVQLGQAYRQDALYWVEADALRVVSCRDGRMAAVGAFSERVRVAAGRGDRSRKDPAGG